MTVHPELHAARLDAIRIAMTDKVLIEVDTVIKHMHSTAVPRNINKPEYAMYEQFALAYNAVADAAVLHDQPDWWWNDQAPELRVGFYNAMKGADLYLWDCEIILSGMSLSVPAHIIRQEELPQHDTFWAFNKTLEVKVDGTKSEVSGVLWIVEKNHVEAILAIAIESGRFDLPHIIRSASFNFGEEFNPDIDSFQNKIKGQLLASLTFLRSEVLVVNKTRVSRVLRRRCEKKSKSKIRPVKVVTLRHTNVKPSGLPAENGKRTYTHRWLVSGHIRNQYYPSTDSHKLIYINPFIKGPEGADLLPARRTVNKVVR